MRDDTNAKWENHFFVLLEEYCDNIRDKKRTDWYMERLKERNIIDSKPGEQQSDLYQICMGLCELTHTYTRRSSTYNLSIAPTATIKKSLLRSRSQRELPARLVQYAIAKGSEKWTVNPSRHFYRARLGAWWSSGRLDTKFISLIFKNRRIQQDDLRYFIDDGEKK